MMRGFAGAMRIDAMTEENETMRDQGSKAAMNRRAMILAAIGAAPLLALSSTSSRAAKMTQKAVGYQDSPKGDRQCDGCNLFEGPKACKTVDGEISPKGWCRIWVKKPA
jgi:uncharacterized membrane protein